MSVQRKSEINGMDKEIMHPQKDWAAPVHCLTCKEEWNMPTSNDKDLSNIGFGEKDLQGEHELRKIIEEKAFIQVLQWFRNCQQDLEKKLEVKESNAIVVLQDLQREKLAVQKLQKKYELEDQNYELEKNCSKTRPKKWWPVVCEKWIRIDFPKESHSKCRNWPSDIVISSARLHLLSL